MYVHCTHTHHPAERVSFRTQQKKVDLKKRTEICIKGDLPFTTTFFIVSFLNRGNFFDHLHSGVMMPFGLLFFRTATMRNDGKLN